MADSNEAKRDTCASIFKEVLRIMWPLVFAMTANAIMVFVDRLFLARYSTLAIQAAIPAGILAFVMVAFLQNVVAYSGTFVAQYAGRGARAACARAMGQGIWLSLMCVPIFLATIPLSSLLLDHVGHAPEVVEQEKIYFFILTLGNMTIPFTSAISGFYSGRGKTRLVMVANLLGNALNIALDPWFIWGGWFVPEMGIFGAGLATTLSQCLILLILLVAILREHHLRTLFRMRVAFAWKPGLLLRMVRFGVPSGVHVFSDCMTFTLFVFLSGRMDELSFAVSNIAFSINHLIFAPLLGIGMAATIVVGQRMGEGNIPAASRAAWITQGIAAIYILLCVIIIGGKCDFILQMFYPTGAGFAYTDYLHHGRALVAIFLAWAFFDSLNIVFSGALKGAGDTRGVLRILLLAAGSIFIPSMLIGYFYFGIIEMWLGMLGYVVILSLCYVWRFYHGHWKTIRLITPHAPLTTDDARKGDEE